MALGLNFDIMSNFSSDGFDEAEKAMGNLQSFSDDLGMSTAELSDRIEAIDELFVDTNGDIKNSAGQYADLNEVMQEAGSEHAAVAAAADEMGESQEFIREQLSRTNMVLHDNSEGAKQFRDMTTGYFKDSAEASETMSDQLQTFEFEALSAMFAAMAVSRAVEGLTDPAMESAGVFEVISDTLEIFFLPIALKVLDFVFWLQDAFLGLPKPVKMFVGALAVIIIIIGKVLTALSILVLNTSLTFGGIATFITGIFSTIGSVILGGLSTVASGVATIMTTIVGILGWPLTITLAVLAAFAVAWSKNLFGIRQKVGKFVQFVGKHFKTIAKIMFMPLEPLNQIIKAINRLTGKSLPTVDDVLSDVGDTIEEMGKGFEESGNKMDEMQKKAPDKKRQGLIDRFMPDIGGKKSEAGGSSNGVGNVQNNFQNKFEIKGTSSMDENELARKIGRRQKEVQDKNVRNR